MKSALAAVLTLALLAAACTPATPPPQPADPSAVFAEAFTNPVQGVMFETTGGTADDAWIIFTTQDRIQLADSERFSVLAPATAVAFFAEAAPETDPVPVEEAVCLSYRELEGGADHGAYLLFVPGSGRYLYRVWDRPAS